MGCGGGSGAADASSGGNSGGGGSGGGGTGSINPTSGEYLLQVGADHNLDYAMIDPTTGVVGSPAVAGGPVWSPGSYPSVLVAPSQKYVYAFQGTIEEVESFQLGGPGLLLTGLGGVPMTQALQSMTLDPSGQHLYVIEGAATIQEFNVGGGGLQEGPGLTVMADMRVMVIDPSGKFLFANDYGGGRIFAYQINPTDGSLSAVAGSPFPTPASTLPPGGLVISGSGSSHFLDVQLATVELQTNDLAAYSIDSVTGALTAVPGSPFSTTSYPTAGLCADPTGKTIYVSNTMAGGIDGFAVDPDTGVLSRLPGSPFGPASMTGFLTVDASGTHIYASAYETSQIYGFNRDPVTGNLTAIPGSPFPSVQQPILISGLTIQ
jgi:6-phosphogluconolactonase (cycloisomerase 2 family)